MTSCKAQVFRAIFAWNFLKIHTFSLNIGIFGNSYVIKRIWNEFSFHRVFMKLFEFLISPRIRLRDIKHTTCFINTCTVWNENSFQILYLEYHRSKHTCISQSEIIRPLTVRGTHVNFIVDYYNDWCSCKRIWRQQKQSKHLSERQTKWPPSTLAPQRL